MSLMDVLNRRGLPYFRTAMKITEILAIAGKPGLYKVLASGSMSIVVESLLDGKRASVPGSARVSNLADITMYTHDEDVPLREVLNRLAEAQKGEVGPSHKESAQAIRDFIDGIVPELDHDRVYQSDLKKLVQWYNLLASHNAFPLEAPELAEDDATDGEDGSSNAAETGAKAAKKPAAKKPAAKKSEANKAAAKKPTAAKAAPKKSAANKATKKGA